MYVFTLTKYLYVRTRIGALRNLEALVLSLRGRLQNSDRTNYENIDIINNIDTSALLKVLTANESDRYISAITTLKSRIYETLRKLSACMNLIDGNTLLNHCNIAKTLNKMKKSKVVCSYIHIFKYSIYIPYIYIYS